MDKRTKDTGPQTVDVDGVRVVYRKRSPVEVAALVIEYCDRATGAGPSEPERTDDPLAASEHLC